jgi:TnpA family transposase
MLIQTGANCSSDSYANDAKHIVQTLHNIVMSEITYIVSPLYWIIYIQNSRLISEHCGLSSAEVYYIYMKNKQHDVTMEIQEFMTMISRNFVYEKSMSIQFYV